MSSQAKDSEPQWVYLYGNLGPLKATSHFVLFIWRNPRDPGAGACEKARAKVSKYWAIKTCMTCQVSYNCAGHGAHPPASLPTASRYDVSSCACVMRAVGRARGAMSQCMAEPHIVVHVVLASGACQQSCCTSQAAPGQVQLHKYKMSSCTCFLEMVSGTIVGSAKQLTKPKSSFSLGKMCRNACIAKKNGAAQLLEGAALLRRATARSAARCVSTRSLHEKEPLRRLPYPVLCSKRRQFAAFISLGNVVALHNPHAAGVQAKNVGHGPGHVLKGQSIAFYEILYRSIYIYT